MSLLHSFFFPIITTMHVTAPFLFPSYQNYNACGLQERQKSILLLDSLLLREMAEELRRDQRQQQAGQSEVVQSIQTTEDKEHNIPFQEVLK